MAPGLFRTFLQHLRNVTSGGEAGPLTDGELLRRFAAGDQAAFAALVARQGPMVYGVCRRVLRQEQDAEDAFQATFLVLARKAATSAIHGYVSNWLHNVAYRVALKARTTAARRTAHESRAAPAGATAPDSAVVWREVRPLLDQELDQLPTKYRAPLVLCYLQGKTYAEASRELGWSRGTLSGRLARAREMLRHRLTRRGLTLSAPALAVALGAATARAAFPDRLQQAAVRGAAWAAAGRKPEGVVSERAAVLAQGVMEGASRSRFKAAALVLAAGLLALAAALLTRAQWPAHPSREGQPQGGGPVAPLPPPRALVKMGELRFRHGSAVKAVAVAPNGRAIASVGSHIRLWEPDTGRELSHFGTPSPAGYHYVVYSADGKKLATADASQITKGSGIGQVWDPATGKEICRLQGRPGLVKTMDFTPDGKALATLDFGTGGLKFWSTTTGKIIGPLIPKQSWVRAFAFAPKVNLLAVGLEIPRRQPSGKVERRLDVWHLATGQLLRRFRGPRSTALVFSLSPSGKVLALGTGNDTVWLWDLAQGQKLHTLVDRDRGVPDPRRMIGSVRFSPDGKTLATSSGKTLVLWDVARGRELRRFTGRMDGFASVGNRDLAFTPDGQTLVTAGGLNSTVRLWDVDTGKEHSAGGGHQGPVEALAYSPDGKTLASAATDRTVRLWDVATGRLLHRLAHGDGPPILLKGECVVAFAQSGKVLASAFGEGAIRLWDVRRGTELRALRGHRGPVKALAFSPDGKTLVSARWHPGNREWWIHHLDVRTGQQLPRFNVVRLKDDPPAGQALSPGGKRLAATGSSFFQSQRTGTIRIWDTATGKCLRILKGSARFEDQQLAFSPDGRYLVARGEDDLVRVWDLRTGTGLLLADPHPVNRPFRRLWDLRTGEERHDPIHLRNRLSFAFAPDGKTLAVGCRDRTVRLVDPATGRERGRFMTDHRGAVISLAFSPGGKRLASGSTDTTVRVWDVAATARAGRSVGDRKLAD
jgi:RNA polymerase sigma factor (sigma-70 family)